MQSQQQYLLTLQVSIYCLLVSQSSLHHKKPIATSCLLATSGWNRKALGWDSTDVTSDGATGNVSDVEFPPRTNGSAESLWGKHDMINQCGFNVGPASPMSAQHYIGIAWTYRVCWVVGLFFALSALNEQSNDGTAHINIQIVMVTKLGWYTVYNTFELK